MSAGEVADPVGAAAAGAIAAVSVPAAVALGIAACLVGGVLAAVMVPRRDDEPGRVREAPEPPEREAAPG